MSAPHKIPHRIFIIGKDINHVLALEAALKIKEVTYLHCEGYPANELKHGPLSMVDDTVNNTVNIGGDGTLTFGLEQLDIINANDKRNDILIYFILSFINIIISVSKWLSIYLFTNTL